MDPQELTLELPWLRLTALAFGPPDGRPALALHGWLDNAASFTRLAPLLPDLRLVALDLPGHGGSQHRSPDAHYHFVDWVVDVAAAADALGWSRFVLVGHSMGAAVASLFAGTLPERVERLVLIEALGPNACAPEEAPARLAGAIAHRARAFQAGPQARAARPSRAFRDVEAAAERLLEVNRDLDPEAARLLVARGTRPADPPAEGVVWRSDPRLRELSPMRVTEEHIRAFLRRVSCPTLVIRARQGMPFDEQLLRGRLSCLAGAELAELDGGHHLHLRDPGPVAEALRRFLAAPRPERAPDPAQQVRLVALDVDGVLTDGGLHYDPEGREQKRFHVADGLGIKLLRRAGLEVAIISGRASPAVAARARELGIAHLHQGVEDKRALLDQLLARLELCPAQVAYMGDDLPDLPVLRVVGFPAAPADARPEVRQAARWVTSAPGGRGAVRELAEHLLKAQGKWDPGAA